jgi:murein DD-endopeptidase MepM/ murein hydrolase activator NlpD
MMIVDTNTVTCTTTGCAAFNNYVWIAHANGEWTKYTHFQPNSVLGNAGLAIGQNVSAGTYLGDEGAIGFAGGQHLHFEVGFPLTGTVNDINVVGGFLTNGVNRIPLFCDIPGNVGFAGDQFVCGPCSGGGCTNDILLTADTIRDTLAYIAADTIDSNNVGIRVDTYGSLSLMAGDTITLRPGFRAAFDSYMHASIRPCNSPP